MNKQAVTTRSFMRSDTKAYVSVGQRIEGAEAYIAELSRVGLVREVAAIEPVQETKSDAPKRGRVKSEDK